MPKITALQTAENLSGKVSNYVTGIRNYLEQQISIIEELHQQATKDMAATQARIKLVKELEKQANLDLTAAKARIELAEQSKIQFNQLMEQFSTITDQAQQAAMQIHNLNQEEQNKLQHRAELQSINRKIAAIKKKQKAEAEKKAQESAQVEIDKQIKELLEKQQRTRRASVLASVRAKHVSVE